MRTSLVLVTLGVAALTGGNAAAEPTISTYVVTFPGPHIAIEGSTNGQPDNCSDNICANFTITVRDFAHNVVSGVEARIDFSGCPDIRIACDQLPAVTGQTVQPGPIVIGHTNASGQFTFKVQGAAAAEPTTSNTTSDGTLAGSPCAKLYVDNAGLIANLIVDAYDVDGLGSPLAAVSGTDVALVAGETLKVALGAAKRARDDYNSDANITGADVALSSRMALQAGLGTGSQNTAPFCP